MGKKLGDFFIYSNLFIAICAVLMVAQTFDLLLHQSPDYHFMGFVFFSTICSYSFHWYLTSQSVLPSSRIGWLQRNRKFHVAFFFIGLAGSAIFFYFLLPHWPWLLLAATITFFYSAPKIPHRYFRALRLVAIGKTIFLAFAWMYVTTILPVIISGAEWNTGDTLFTISRFFLIYSICILFDYRDREDDKASGVRSLITYLNERSIAVLFMFSIVVFAASTLLLLKYDHKLVSVIALLIPGLITASLYNVARRNFSDIFFYLVLDGLMALSSILTLFPGI
jgi:4-hydroxybenzoate polyprenyltransferase